LIEPLSRGDPESALRWTCKSVRRLAQELGRGGHRVSHTLVAELLHELGYSLQANAKTLEGSSHPDRNAQFEHIRRKVQRFLKDVMGHARGGGRDQGERADAHSLSASSGGIPAVRCFNSLGSWPKNTV
jgi:hypothetical protein